MNPVLLLPTALAALAALIVPLLIHLARRSEQRPTDFAALRWLRQRPKPRHRIRFDEWLLLALRLLLLALIALLLARPAVYGARSQAPWVAVVPGVDAQALAATPRPAGARLHWLAPGFAEIDLAGRDPASPTPAANALPVSSLLRELDAGLPAGVALSVWVPERLQGVDGQRPRLSRQVQWRVLPGEMPARPEPRRPVPEPSIRYAADRAAALPYLRAAIAAWRPAAAAGASAAKAANPGAGEPARTSADAPAQASAGASIAADSQPLAPDTKQLLWLKPGPLPAAIEAWIADGGTALLDAGSAWPGGEGAAIAPLPLWRNPAGEALVEGAPYRRGRVMRLTRALDPQAMPELLEPGFAAGLRDLFEPPRDAPARVLARDHAPSSGAAPFAASPLDLRPWLALLIGLLFVLERWLATRPRRGAAP